MTDLLERIKMRHVIFTQRGFVFQRDAGKISRSHGAGLADVDRFVDYFTFESGYHACITR
jgi:hypothetical protein